MAATIIPIGTCNVGADSTPSNPTTAVVNVPTGTIDGDVMVCQFEVPDGTGAAPAVPAGWTQIDVGTSGTGAGDIRMVTGYRVASSEPANYTFSYSGVTTGAMASIRTYRGVDTASPIADHSIAFGASSTNAVATAVSPAMVGAMLVGMFAQGDSLNGWTPPSGMSEAADAQNNPTGTANDSSIEVAELRLTSSGTTGTKTATTAGAAIWAAALIALTPSPDIKYHGSSSATVNATASTIVVTVPTGTIDGDVLVMGVSARGNLAGSAVTTPSGWTLRGTPIQTGNGVADQSLYMFTRVASSEPASYTVTVGSTTRIMAAMLAYSGVDNTTPFDVASGNSGASSASAVAPTLSAAATGEMLVEFFASVSNSTWTAPTGSTERVDISVGSVTSFEAADELLSASGATGTRTATSSVAGVWCAAMLTLKGASTAASVSATVVAAVVAVPSPTVATGAGVSPGAVTASASVPSPAESTGSTFTPAVVIAVASIPAPAVATGSQLTAVTVGAVTSVPSPAVATGESLTAVVVAAVASVPAPTVTTGAGVTAVAVAATTAVPSPALSTDSQVSATVVAAIAGVPSPDVATGSAFAVSVVAAAAAVPSPVIATGASLEAVAVAAVAAVPDPSLTTGASLVAVVVQAVAAVPQPDLATDQAASPSVVTALAAIPSPDIATGSVVSGAVVVAAASVPSPAISTALSFTPAVVTALAAVPQPDIATGTSLDAIPVSAVAVIPAPDIATEASPAPSSVVAVASVPSPALAAGASLVGQAVAALAAIPAPTVAIAVSVQAAAVVASAIVPGPDITTRTDVGPFVVQAIAAIPAVQTAFDATVLIAVVVAVASVPGPGLRALFAKPNIDSSLIGSTAGAQLTATTNEAASTSTTRESVTVASIWEGT